jgi:hypothetical protein
VEEGGGADRGRDRAETEDEAAEEQDVKEIRQRRRRRQRRSMQWWRRRRQSRTFNKNVTTTKPTVDAGCLKKIKYNIYDQSKQLFIFIVLLVCTGLANKLSSLTNSSTVINGVPINRPTQRGCQSIVQRQTLTLANSPWIHIAIDIYLEDGCTEIVRILYILWGVGGHIPLLVGWITHVSPLALATPRSPQVPSLASEPAIDRPDGYLWGRPWLTATAAAVPLQAPTPATWPRQNCAVAQSLPAQSPGTAVAALVGGALDGPQGPSPPPTETAVATLGQWAYLGHTRALRSGDGVQCPRVWHKSHMRADRQHASPACCCLYPPEDACSHGGALAKALCLRQVCQMGCAWQTCQHCGGRGPTAGALHMHPPHGQVMGQSQHPSTYKPPTSAIPHQAPQHTIAAPIIGYSNILRLDVRQAGKAAWAPTVWWSVWHVCMWHGGDVFEGGC